MHGLANIGNTCFINTLVQCIGHADRLRKWFENVPDSDRIMMCTEMRSLLKDMWIEGKSIIPHRFVEYIYRTFALARGEQHDLNELLLFFLDKVEEESGFIEARMPLDTRVPRYAATKTAYLTLCTNAISAWQKYHSKGFTSFTHTIEGLYIHQVKCQQCNKYFHNFEPYTILNLNIDDCDSVKTAIDRHFESEHIKDWKCDNCHTVLPAEKVLRIWSMPKVLMVVLKRFKLTACGYKKVNAEIDIPQRLSFGRKQIIGPNTSKRDDNSLLFNLKSVGLHHGSMGMGHYTCVANCHGTWRHYDDLMVNDVQDMNEVCKKNRDAYLLIYEEAN